MKKITVLLICIAIANTIMAQTQKEFTIAFYNVENLFDTKHDEGKEDREFLPTAKKKWTIERYNKKVEDLAKVISSLNKSELPEVIGVAEIENKIVLEDLIKQKTMINKPYGIVHEESPDFRGIDVALLYRKDEFTYLSHKAFKIIFPFAKDVKTRDILYVKGIASSKDTLHIFVNHWSSRREGQLKSEPRRVFNANLLRTKVDSIQKLNPSAKVIIMGDMNDEPQNKSLKETLKATNNREKAEKGEMYNLMYDRDLKNEGTYNYKGDWNMLDNLIVSQALLKSNKGYKVDYDAGQIYKEKWILYNNVKTGNYTPSRTYGGSNYYGGYSDHLPVYIILKL